MKTTIIEKLMNEIKEIIDNAVKDIAFSGASSYEEFQYKRGRIDGMSVISNIFDDFVLTVQKEEEQW